MRDALLAEVEALTPTDRSRIGGDLIILVGAMGLLRIAHHDELLDRLRRSTVSYAAAHRALWRRVGVTAPSTAMLPVGTPAPTITGDFWFPREAGASPRPTRGRIALVVFVEHALRCLPATTTYERDGCPGEHAALRRLAERFPMLEVTVVAQTRGYLVDAAIPAPAEEAEWLRRWLHDGQHLPGALAVSATPFSTLDAPDGRRLDGTTAPTYA